MKSYLALFLGGVLLPAQVAAPNVGFARFADGRVFAVHGLPANLLVAKVPWLSADVISFSDAGGLVSQNGVVQLIGPAGVPLADYVSGEAAPVLNMDGPLTSAIAWLPAKHALLHWSGKAFALHTVPDFSFAGDVTYVQILSPRLARLLVAQSDASVSAVTVSLDTGEVISADLVPSSHGAAFGQSSFIVSEAKEGLVVESASGERRLIPLAQTPLPERDLTMQRMSTSWLHIYSASTGRHWALYLNDKNLHLSALPVPPSSLHAKAIQ